LSYKLGAGRTSRLIEALRREFATGVVRAEKIKPIRTSTFAIWLGADIPTVAILQFANAISRAATVQLGMRIQLGSSNAKPHFAALPKQLRNVLVVGTRTDAPSFRGLCYGYFWCYLPGVHLMFAFPGRALIPGPNFF